MAAPAGRLEALLPPATVRRAGQETPSAMAARQGLDIITSSTCGTSRTRQEFRYLIVRHC
jgi:hypothetical protein